MADLVSAVAAAITLLLGWLAIRNSQLRKEEVVSWANESIRALQSLLVAGILADREDFKTRSAELVNEAIIDTSVLIEQGRIYFRNEVRHDGHGIQKPEAYRGYRPRLLDSLVIAHQVACQWATASAVDKRKMLKLLEAENKFFVSMVQKEIGRQRTVSTDTKIGGTDINLKTLLKGMSDPGPVRRGRAPGRPWV